MNQLSEPAPHAELLILEPTSDKQAPTETEIRVETFNLIQTEL